jgi:hypothetical protein
VSRKAIEVALRLLQHRFGQLSPNFARSRGTTSYDSLEELAPAVNEFSTLADAD